MDELDQKIPKENKIFVDVRAEWLFWPLHMDMTNDLKIDFEIIGFALMEVIILNPESWSISTSIGKLHYDRNHTTD